MRVYLNTSALNRPFDDLSSPRIRAEAEAMVNLIAAVESGHLALVSSAYLLFEVGQGPYPERVRRVLSLVGLAQRSVATSVTLAQRARQLEKFGLRGLDALHVASAEEAKADLLITTDDRMIRAVKRAGTAVALRVVLPNDALGIIAREV